MRLYLSHSLAPADRPVLDLLSEACGFFELELKLGERPWAPPTAMPPHIGRAIVDADCVLTLITIGGPHAEYATLEAGFIRNVCDTKPVLRIFEKGLQPPGCLEFSPAIWLDPSRPWTAARDAHHKLHHEHKFDPLPRTRLLAFLLASLGFLTALRGGSPLLEPAKEIAGARGS